MFVNFILMSALHMIFQQFFIVKEKAKISLGYPSIF